MASFTDTPQVYLPHGAPVADLNLYDNALSTKQGQYNSGVARIQGSVDSIAGLDVARQIDKQYLQSKLDEVGTQLKQVAGGDFSNPSLVSQASSMAPKIAKDPIVQNALISTHSINQLMSSQKTKEKASKYTDVERFHDNKEVNRYLNSSDLQDSYRGNTEATEYYDGLTALQNAIKEKAPDVETYLNNYGQLMYKTDKRTTRTPEQIQQIIDTEMSADPRIAQHFSMVGEYNFRGDNEVSFKDRLLREQNNVVAPYQGMIDALTDQMSKDSDQNVPRYAAQIAQYQGEINKWKGYNKGDRYVPGYYDDLIQHIDNGDLDYARQSYMMKQVQANLIQKYAKNDNDIALQVNESAKYALDQKNKDIEHDFERKRLGIEADKSQWEKDKFFMEHPEYKNNGGGAFPVISNDPSGDSYTPIAHQEKLAALSSLVGDGNSKFNQDIYRIWSSKFPGQPQDKFKAYLDAQEQAYTHNDPSIDADYMGLRNSPQYSDAFRAKEKLLRQSAQIENSANQKFKLENAIPHPVTINMDAHIIGHDGRQATSMVIDPAHDHEFISQLTDVNARIQNEIARQGTSTLGGSMTGAAQGANVNPAAITQQVLESYKGSPYYEDIKNVILHGNSKQLDKALIAPQAAQLADRHKFINEAYKELGKNTNYVGSILGEKQQKLARDIIQQQNFPDVAINPKETETLGLKSVASYRDEAQRVHITGHDAKGNYFDKVPNIEGGESIASSDPYQSLSADLDQEGMTTSDPKYALHTDDNKMSFQIRRNNNYILNPKTGLREKPVYNVAIIGPGGIPIATKLYDNGKQTLIDNMNVISSKYKTREDIINAITQGE